MEHIIKIIIGLIAIGLIGWLGIKCFDWIPGFWGDALGTILCILALYVGGKIITSD